MVDARLELAEAAAQASLAEATGWPLLRLGAASCIVNPHLRDNTMLNRVNGLGVDGPVSDRVLDELEAFFREHGTRYAVGVSPLAPPDLEPRLRERGLDDGYAWMKFRRSDEEPPAAATSLRIGQVTVGDEFGRIIAAAYGMPAGLGESFLRLPEAVGWHCFVAYDGDEPAGAAALFTDDGIGWLGAAGTRPEHRGKGAQGALLAARLRRARELGLAATTTETGERTADRPSGSYRNILRAGFSEAYLRPNLVSTG